MKLRGGYEAEDPRLDRVPEFDERSRKFPIRAIASMELRGRSWPCGPTLDQGREGACVGFAWMHEAAATPVVVKAASEVFAREIYRAAQKLDQWPGEAYEGTSVLAGAKVMVAHGLIGEYRWAFGIDDVCGALANHGPVVLGIPWLDSMMDPAPSGLLDCTGRQVGGHAILARGLILKPTKAVYGTTEPLVRLRNSWGHDFGRSGDCFVKVGDLDRLLGRLGDACVPVTRHRERTT